MIDALVAAFFFWRLSTVLILNVGRGGAGSLVHIFVWRLAGSRYPRYFHKMRARGVVVERALLWLINANRSL